VYWALLLWDAPQERFLNFVRHCSGKLFWVFHFLVFLCLCTLPLDHFCPLLFMQPDMPHINIQDDPLLCQLGQGQTWARLGAKAHVPHRCGWAGEGVLRVRPGQEGNWFQHWRQNYSGLRQVRDPGRMVHNSDMFWCKYNTFPLFEFDSSISTNLLMIKRYL